MERKAAGTFLLGGSFACSGITVKRFMANCDVMLIDAHVSQLISFQATFFSVLSNEKRPESKISGHSGHKEECNFRIQSSSFGRTR